MAKLVRNKNYTSNLQQIKNKFVVKKRVTRKVTEKQFLNILTYAKKSYVDKLIKFTRNDLKRKYGLPKHLLDRLVVELTRYEEEVLLQFTAEKVEELTQVMLPQEITLLDHLNDIRCKIKDEVTIHGTQTAIIEGFVYLVTNKSWPTWYKVGMTTDYEMRLSTYNMYDPECNFEFLDIKWVSDRRASEKHLHTVFDIHATKRNGEWFFIEENKAKILFQTIA